LSIDRYITIVEGLEAENPEPDKLQPRVSAAIYIGWLGTPGWQ
jgi:hypothetical protein